MRPGDAYMAGIIRACHLTHLLSDDTYSQNDTNLLLNPLRPGHGDSYVAEIIKKSINLFGLGHAYVAGIISLT